MEKLHTVTMTLSHVIYHVATLMPTDLTSDPVCSCKKLHIGNDFVTIVYNDSGSEYKFGTLKVWASELIRACFVIYTVCMFHSGTVLWDFMYRFEH